MVGANGIMMTAGHDTTIESVVNTPPVTLEPAGSVSHYPVGTGVHSCSVPNEKSSGRATPAAPGTFDGEPTQSGAASSQNPTGGRSKKGAERDIMSLAMTRDLGQGQGVVLSPADSHSSLQAVYLLQGQQITGEVDDAALLTTATTTPLTPGHPRLSQTHLDPHPAVLPSLSGRSLLGSGDPSAALVTCIGVVTRHSSIITPACETSSAVTMGTVRPPPLHCPRSSPRSPTREGWNAGAPQHQVQTLTHMG